MMKEMHICKICSANVSQLQRHLTMRHNRMNLNEYLKEFKCGEEFNKIDKNLRKDRAKNSPWSIEYYISRGKTEEEAVLLINEKRKTRKKQKTTPSNSNHWVSKGYSLEDAEIRAQQYRSDIGRLPSLESYITRFGETIGKDKWNEYQSKIKNRQETFLSRASTVKHEAKLIRWFKNSRTEHGPVLKKFSYDNYDSYCDAVRTATKISIAVYGNIIDPEKNKLGIIYGKNGYAVDHKFSKYGGFVNKIHPLIIGSYQNLQLIPKKENCRKGQYCIVAIEEVLGYKTILDDKEISSDLKDRINEIFIEQS